MRDGPSNTFRVVQIQTRASADIVVRNAKGRKLFEINLPGVSVTVTIPTDGEIKIEPDRRGEDHNG
jgi:hypothetical protein